MLKFFTKRNYVYFDAISQAILILKIFRRGIKLASFLLNYIAIQSTFILSAECKYRGVQHGWTECEHNNYELLHSYF